MEKILMTVTLEQLEEFCKEFEIEINNGIITKVSPKEVTNE